MKTYLNVLGMLAIVGGVILAVSEGNGAWLGAALLPSGLCWGLARLIELGETHLERTSAHRLLERDFWKLVAANLPGAGQGVPPDGAKWYAANGQEVSGPFDLDQLRALLAKGLVNEATRLRAVDGKEWVGLASVVR